MKPGIRATADLSGLKPGDRFSPHCKLNNAMVPFGLLRADISIGKQKVSLGAKLCWGVLASYAGSNGLCFPLQQTIASDMNVSLDTVKRYVHELRKAHLIEIEYRSTGRIRQSKASAPRSFLAY